MIKYFSMFTGIGGFEKGIEETGLPFECVGFSEINPYAESIYKFHYPNHKNYGDATTIIPGELPGFQLLVGGFPCQAFSIAGKRRGFEDTRGTLFFDIARICETVRPPYLLLENVKGLISHDDRRTFTTIINSLDKLGYTVQTLVFNSKYFGVPQNRERTFIVGHLRGECQREILFKRDVHKVSKEENGTDGGRTQAEFVSTTLRGSNVKADNTFIIVDKNLKPKNRDYASCLTGGGNSGGNHSDMDLIVENDLKQIGVLGKDSEATRVYDPEGIARTIKNGGGGGAKTGLYQIPRGYNKGGVKDICGTLTSNKFEYNNFLLEDSKIRRLTPVECERLQGYPDGWTEFGLVNGEKVKISDTQRYKCLGNAVTVNVIKWIITNLFSNQSPGSLRAQIY